MEPAQFKEGVGVETRAKTMVLMNQAPHPNAAKVFLNWFLSREGQSDFQKTAASFSMPALRVLCRMDIRQRRYSAAQPAEPRGKICAAVESGLL